MALLLLINGWDPHKWVEEFHKVDPSLELRLWPDVGNHDDIDYIVAWKPDPGTMSGYANLKAIFSLGAGVDHITKDPDLPPVPIARIVDPNLTLRMTEWVVLQVLLHHRRHLDFAAQQRQSQWTVLDQPAAPDVRVGIMGLGVLGQDSANALSFLGFDVAGWSRTPKQLDGITGYHGDDGLGDFLARTDILVALLPHTSATDDILNMRLFKQLARDGELPGPVIINAGRGGLQNEDDILAALNDGTLNAASLDVFRVEPLDQQSPLWSHPRAIIYPHVAAESDPKRLSRNVVDQIKAMEQGRPLENVVDPVHGY